MLTDVQIINLGLSKLASLRVSTITPPRTPLESFMGANYGHWKRTELTKNKWVFAVEDDYLLTLNDTLADVDQPYKYILPVDCLRPIRGKYTEWKQRGTYLYSANSTLKISYIRNAAESEFDPLFNEVLACKVAFESAEYVTQSSTKRAVALQAYDDAISEAKKANAFVVGPEDVTFDDNDFSWVTAHHNGGSW